MEKFFIKLTSTDTDSKQYKILCEYLQALCKSPQNGLMSKTVYTKSMYPLQFFKLNLLTVFSFRLYRNLDTLSWSQLLTRVFS